MPRYRMVSKSELSIPKLVVIEKDAVVFESLFCTSMVEKKQVELSVCMNHHTGLLWEFQFYRTDFKIILNLQLLYVRTIITLAFRFRERA